MSKESERLGDDIACIPREGMSASLVSTKGAHCEVWRSAGTLKRKGHKFTLDFIIKRYLGPCSLAEIRSLARQYRQLRSALRDIVPAAVFVATCINGERSVCVLAEPVNIWFNIANPRNESEAIPLLGTLPKARRQLELFLDAARQWHAEDNARVIDLFGVDNLVLDVNRQVRYLDSFHVFFFQDMLDMYSDDDSGLRDKIEMSLHRLNYLEYLVRVSRR